MNKIILLTSLILITHGCSQKSNVEISVNSCIEEIDKSYQNRSQLDVGTIYKVLNIDEKSEELSIGVYHNTGMFFLGRRPSSYFSEGRRFRYESIPCPETGKKKILFKETIKDIDFNSK